MCVCVWVQKETQWRRTMLRRVCMPRNAIRRFSRLLRAMLGFCQHITTITAPHCLGWRTCSIHTECSPFQSEVDCVSCTIMISTAACRCTVSQNTFHNVPDRSPPANNKHLLGGDISGSFSIWSCVCVCLYGHWDRDWWLFCTQGLSVFLFYFLFTTL